MATQDVPITDVRGTTVRLLHHLLDQAAESHGEAAALRDTAGVWTYAELAAASQAAANWLRAQGVRPGHRVVVGAFPQRHVVALLYGCSRLGAAFAPVSPYMPEYQLNAVLADIRPSLTLCDAQEIVAAVAFAERMAATSARPAATTPPGPEGSAVEVTPPVQGFPRPTDTALLLLTSGSTAVPKAVICPHRPILFATDAIARRLRYRPDDVVYCRLPLSFDYGLYQVFLAAQACAELVLAEASPAADARLLSALHTAGATVVPVVPSLATMLVRLARRPGPRPPVRLFTNTGEHLSQQLADELRASFPGAGLHMMYGTTECKRVTIAERDADVEHPGSVGKPLDGTTVRISGPDGSPLPPGQSGEITVSGPHLMSGYWEAPQLTAQVFGNDPETGQPMLYTGDFGHMDASGHLYFEGRRDHIFKQRGVRTSTVEIEAAAQTLPGVISAVVLPPGSTGEAVLCVLGEARQETVQRGLRSLVGPAKVPPVCRVFRDFPLTANGKIDRNRLTVLVRDEDDYR
ncbi:AMP-binding protein [Streptomyces sp. NPDC050164]|uniref:AMP-binding protein n=1 Tax=Streptomyces sp. NPDC050164 TaxID=3365605 RepID=UPI0037BCABE1